MKIGINKPNIQSIRDAEPEFMRFPIQDPPQEGGNLDVVERSEAGDGPPEQWVSITVNGQMAPTTSPSRMAVKTPKAPFPGGSVRLFLNIHISGGLVYQNSSAEWKDRKASVGIASFIGWTSVEFLIKSHSPSTGGKLREIGRTRSAGDAIPTTVGVEVKVEGDDDVVYAGVGAVDDVAEVYGESMGAGEEGGEAGDVLADGPDDAFGAGVWWYS
ncbi:unnamed protein product [Musa banksii]